MYQPGATGWFVERVDHVAFFPNRLAPEPARKVQPIDEFQQRLFTPTYIYICVCVCEAYIRMGR